MQAEIAVLHFGLGAKPGDRGFSDSQGAPLSKG
jgi:hypothetical protein